MIDVTQLFPNKTITTVAYGTTELGYPMVLVATSDGHVATLQANGYTVEQEFTVRIISPQPSLQE
jgi:hypothetical protein